MKIRPYDHMSFTPNFVGCEKIDEPTAQPSKRKKADLSDFLYNSVSGANDLWPNNETVIVRNIYLALQNYIISIRYSDGLSEWVKKRKSRVMRYLHGEDRPLEVVDWIFDSYGALVDTSSLKDVVIMARTMAMVESIPMRITQSCMMGPNVVTKNDICSIISQAAELLGEPSDAWAALNYVNAAYRREAIRQGKE